MSKQENGFATLTRHLHRWPEAIDIDPKGTLYFTDVKEGSLYRIKRKKDGCLSSVEELLIENLNKASGISIDGEHNVLYLGTGIKLDNEIKYKIIAIPLELFEQCDDFPAAYADLKQLADENQVQIGEFDISQPPNGVVYDRKSNSVYYTWERLSFINYFLKRKGHIGRIHLGNNEETIIKPQVFSPNGIDIDRSSDETALIYSITLEDTIQKLPGIKDAVIASPHKYGKTGVRYPDGLLCLENGNLLVAAFGSGKIFYLFKKGDHFIDPVEIVNGLDNPTDLAIGPSSRGDGRSLYVTTKSCSIVHRLKTFARGRVVEIPDIELRIEKAIASDTNAKAFMKVLREELDEIKKSRQKRRKLLTGTGFPPVPTSDNFLRDAADSQILGLAFSGGGIRSATFNLGILQGLARFNFLPRLDYLSTVSGGGYIGSWFTTWIKRRKLETVIEGLKRSSGRNNENEADEIKFLRQFSNYLTPKVGLLNTDSLTTVSIYLRNLLLNLTILVSALSVALLLPRIFAIINIGAEKMPLFVFLPGFAVVGIIATIFIHKHLSYEPHKHPPKANKPHRWFLKLRGIHLGILVPTLLAAWLLAASLKANTALWSNFRWILLAVLIVTMINSILWYRAGVLKGEALLRPFFVLIAGLIGGVLVWQLTPIFNGWPEIQRVVLGVPLVLSLFAFGGVFYIGLMGLQFETQSREWWGRLGSWMLIYGIGFLVVFAISLYGPAWLAWIGGKFSHWANKALASGWLLITIGGLLAGQSSRTGPKGSAPLLRIFALAAPYVFILGMALSLALILDEILAALAPAGLPDSGRASGILLLLGGFTFIAAFLSWRVNINAFSMHNFYRNRLVRCYIGASDRDREPHPFTGFDMREHRVRLSDMVTDEPDLNDQRIKDADLREPYAGPYPIINAALNLVSGENLAWQHRKATAFIFSPKYTGYEVWEQSKHKKPGWLARVGYRPTRYYPDGISLGTAMAISGAAVSPNMGRFSSPALAFLMTVFNVRLGWWLGNPRHRLAWLKSGPVAGLTYLFFELFGMTNDQRGYVYLSDGGHFENLGIYELVKRRCRYIIACDGGQDREFTFGDLGSAIEKCRTDFGVDIEIDLGSLRKNSKHPYSQWHCAVGKIRYDKLDARFAAGTILYLKSSLSGDEPVDVLRYAEENKEFPHQSTADQWFDESQFESYRALGEHIVKSVFEAVGEHDDIASMTTEEVFVALQKNWFPPSEAFASAFTKHADTLERIFSQIRDDEHLRFLDHQIYPEWQTLLENTLDYSEMNLWLPGTYDELRAGFYMSNQMIQLMENVYHDLNLEKEFENPDNRGWMNLFHHFSWSGMFRVAWAISASTYGARFQNFCKRRLKLDVGEVQIGQPQTIAHDPAIANQAIEKLKKDLVINFFETDLVRRLIKSGEDVSEYIIYPFQLKVAIPAREDYILFNFGFALTANQKLKYFRVQDHLRKMGLGRRALYLLIHRHNITDFERIDPHIKDPGAPPVEEIHKFETLFISVQNEIVD